MRKYNNFELHFRFDIKNDNIRFLNAEYVHPLKQDLVQELQQEFSRDTNVRRVIVFGSGVEFRCNSYSDLDLCIERYDSSKTFHPDSEEEIDILYEDRIGDRIKREIEEKGIVVFEREQ